VREISFKHQHFKGHGRSDCILGSWSILGIDFSSQNPALIVLFLWFLA